MEEELSMTIVKLAIKSDGDLIAENVWIHKRRTKYDREIRSNMKKTFVCDSKLNDT